MGSSSGENEQPEKVTSGCNFADSQHVKWGKLLYSLCALPRASEPPFLFKESTRHEIFLKTATAKHSTIFCSPIICENFCLRVGFDSAPADLQAEVHRDRFHGITRVFGLTGRSADDRGAHLYNNDLNLHVCRQIQLGLETFHHGNQQMNGGQEVFVVDD